GGRPGAAGGRLAPAHGRPRRAAARSRQPHPGGGGARPRDVPAAGGAGVRLYTAGVISEPAIREALVGVIDPELRRSVVELDMVRAVGVSGDRVQVTIALTVPGCPMKADLERQVRERVGAVDGVGGVAVAFDVMTPEQRTAL